LKERKIIINEKINTKRGIETNKTSSSIQINDLIFSKNIWETGMTSSKKYKDKKRMLTICNFFIGN
jgi:hypothetical protein